VIREVADVLRQTVRELDIICRFGGEEFIVFLFDHKSEDGFLVAERIRRAVSAKNIISKSGPISVTVSIGGALKDRLDDFNVAIKQADDALYAAKKAGRNRTIFASLGSLDKTG
jgi:diguanylate cyclase (GGDEF)-like protein